MSSLLPTPAAFAQAGSNGQVPSQPLQPPSQAPPKSSSSRSRSPHRQRSRSRSRERRDRSPPRHASSSSSSSSSSKLSVKKNRALCTIFVSGLHPKIDDMDLFEFFSHVGRVEDIQFIKDPRTGKSKGHAYVEFSNPEDAEKSCRLSNQLVGGYPITISMTKVDQLAGDKKSAKPVALSSTTAATPPDGLRIYVGSLHFTINESDIKPIFEAFGPITGIELHRDPGQSITRGFGFVTFQKKEDGETAIAALDGFLVGNRPMKVGYASASNSSGGATTTTKSTPAQPVVFLQNLPLIPTPAAYPPTGVIPPPVLLPVLPFLTPAQMTPSTCLSVTNMFIAAEETDPEWWVDLEEDVREEVTKYGELVNIRVDKDSPIGQVWMRFTSLDAAVKCQKAMHGRFFSERQLTAAFVPEGEYDKPAKV